MTHCITTLPSAFNTATEMVSRWTSRPTYLMLSIGCSFRQAWFTAHHSNHSLLRKGRPFIMRGPDNQKTTMRVPHSSRFCLSGSFLPYRPPRSNFNHSFFSRDIVTIAAPRPVFRSLDEPSCDRITVDVFQLLCAFGATPDIEIVIPWLPEVFATSDEAPRDGLFRGFQSSSEYCALRFGH
jgi:hypothetical protein